MDSIRLVIARLPGAAPLCVTEDWLLDFNFAVDGEDKPRKATDINEAIGFLGGNGMRYEVKLRDRSSLTARDSTEIEARLWQFDPTEGVPTRRPELYNTSAIIQYITSWDLVDSKGEDVPLTPEGFLSLEDEIATTLVNVVLPRYARGASWGDYFRKSRCSVPEDM